MEIIKSPEFEVIVCDCGLVFMPTFGDIFEYRMNATANPPDRVLCVRCPLCGTYLEAVRVKK